MMDNIVVTIVGCSDAFSSGGRNNTCFHIKSRDVVALIDCGQGALTGLHNNGFSTTDIDVIVITHFHGDHFAGLPFVVFDMVKNGRKNVLTIITPPGGKDKLEQALALFYPGSAVLGKLDISFIEFSGRQEITSGELRLETFPVVHIPESLPHAIRLTTDNRIIAYTGDTEWTETIPGILAHADLAICECTFYSKKTKGHMDYLSLKNHIPEMEFKRLLLTHFDKEMFDNLDMVKYDCAYDGMVIYIPR
jgi:ribonuclease BN (tRNA processing enzyme)